MRRVRSSALRLLVIFREVGEFCGLRHNEGDVDRDTNNEHRLAVVPAADDPLGDEIPPG